MIYLTSLLQTLSTSVINDVQIHTSTTLPISGSVTLTNPVTSITAKTSTTSWGILSAVIPKNVYTTLPSHPADRVTILNTNNNIVFVSNSNNQSLGFPLNANNATDIDLVANTNEVTLTTTKDNFVIYATYVKYN